MICCAGITGGTFNSRLFGKKRWNFAGGLCRLNNRECFVSADYRFASQLNSGHPRHFDGATRGLYALCDRLHKLLKLIYWLGLSGTPPSPQNSQFVSNSVDGYLDQTAFGRHRVYERLAAQRHRQQPVRCHAVCRQ